MVLQLPAEILQLVLSIALEHEAPPQRQRIRRSFVSVCRGWAASVARFQQIEVIGSHQLLRLTSPASFHQVDTTQDFTSHGDQAAATFDKVKSLYVELSDTDGFAPTEVADDALAKLLGWCANITCLEIRIGDRNEPEGHSSAPGFSRHYDQNECSLSETIRTALISLTQLTSFTLGGLTSAQPIPGFSPHLLRLWELVDPNPRAAHHHPYFHLLSFMRYWSQLRFVDINNCIICAHESEEGDEEVEEEVTATSVGLFSGLAQLQQVRLQSGLGGSSYRHILSHLPPSVQVLTIDDSTIYAYGKEYGSLGRSVTNVLLPVARQLTRLTITDTPQPNQQHRISTARGVYDHLVRSLVNVEELTISPCALYNLAESLDGLSSLRALRLVQGFGVCAPPFEPNELIQLLNKQSSISEVVVKL